MPDHLFQSLSLTNDAIVSDLKITLQHSIRNTNVPQSLINYKRLQQNFMQPLATINFVLK